MKEYLNKTELKSIPYQLIPEGCEEEYNEEICSSCEHNGFDMVAHPGGGCDGTRSVEKHYCGLGYWEENF